MINITAKRGPMQNVSGSISKMDRRKLKTFCYKRKMPDFIALPFPCNDVTITHTAQVSEEIEPFYL